MLYNTKYKIQEGEKVKTLEIIFSLGFELALAKAYEKALEVLEKSPDSASANVWLAWSFNLANEAKELKVGANKDGILCLARFYRHLAHKIYWYQRKNKTIGLIKEFIQEV